MTSTAPVVQAFLPVVAQAFLPANLPNTLEAVRLRGLPTGMSAKRQAGMLALTLGAFPSLLQCAVFGALVVMSSASVAADFRLEHDVFGTAAGESSGGMYRISDVGGQPCVGRSESASYSVEYGFWSTLGSAPVPGALTRTVKVGQPLTISMDEIISQAADPDGDAISVRSVLPLSAQGGTANLGTNAIFYTGPSAFAGIDQFTYTLVDAGGDVAAGSVVVNVGGAEPARPRVIFGPLVTNGVLVVRFQGEPGATYTLESTDLLDPPLWQKQFNLTAPVEPADFGVGIFEVRDIITGSFSRFFRTVYPAY